MTLTHLITTSYSVSREMCVRIAYSTYLIPGFPVIRLIYKTPIGCRSLRELSIASDALAGSGD